MSGRKVVLYAISSLDGAVDDPTRSFPSAESPAPPTLDDDLIAHEARLLASQDAVLMGRGTYDEWARCWPTSTVQPFADFINALTKYVVTSRPLTPAWANAEVVFGPLRDVVTALKDRSGGDIRVHGSITLAQVLTREDLVDELHLAVAPVLDPVGRRLSDGLPDLIRLVLVERATATAEALGTHLIYAGFSFRVMSAQRLAQTRPGARGALLIYSCVPATEFGETRPAGVSVQIHGKEGDEFFAEDLPAAQALVASMSEAESSASRHAGADLGPTRQAERALANFPTARSLPPHVGRSTSCRTRGDCRSSPRPCRAATHAGDGPPRAEDTARASPYPIQQPPGARNCKITGSAHAIIRRRPHPIESSPKG